MNQWSWRNEEKQTRTKLLGRLRTTTDACGRGF